jgi:hypothetical protein
MRPSTVLHPSTTGLTTVCRMVHIEEIRKNLYKGVLEGCSFSTIES